MKSTGKFLVGGNWKCNGTLDSVSKLISELNSAKIPDDIEVVVAPTFVHLQLAVDKLSPRYQVSAQNCWVGKQGAYTGEVGAPLTIFSCHPLQHQRPRLLYCLPPVWFTILPSRRVTS